MSVYFMVQETVFDQDGMPAYGKLAGPTLEGVNVKALAVENDAQTIEGEWHGAASWCSSSIPKSRSALGNLARIPGGCQTAARRHGLPRRVGQGPGVKPSANA